MYSDKSKLGRNLSPSLHRAALGLLPVLLFAAWGCGHKSAPIPPPLRHPAAAKDLVVQQRGEELLISVSYPQTTVSGTVLEPLQRVEVWELVRPVPEWTPPSTDDDQSGGEAEAATAARAEDEAENDALEEGSQDVFERGSGSGDDPSRADAAASEDRESDAVENESVAASAAEVEERADSAEDSDIDTEPPPVRPSDEQLLTVSSSEFAATAVLRTALEDADLTAATFGDRLVLSLPIEAVPAPREAPDAPAEDAPRVEGEIGSSPAPAKFGSIIAVKTSVGGRFTSNFSNLAVIAHREAPEPPAGFALEPQAAAIVMNWTVAPDAESTGLLGFHVYRRDAESPTYGPPLAFVPLEPPAPVSQAAAEVAASEAEEAETREYSDRSAVLGQRYIYALTSVSNRAPVVESAITSEREIDFADRFAPTPPRNLVTLPASDRIRILWDASPEADVAGYFVSRREAEGSFERLHQEPLTSLEFEDREVQSGRSYAYRVVAIDELGNESAPSAVTEVRAP